MQEADGGKGVTCAAAELCGIALNSRRCSFEQIGLHFKAENCRFSGAKARFFNAEMQPKMPKMRFGDFRNTP